MANVSNGLRPAMVLSPSAPICLAAGRHCRLGQPNPGCELARHPAAQSLDLVTRSDYDQFVKVAELRRWLRKQGCSFVEESRHTRIILGSKVSRMPRHPAKEIKKGTLQSILRDLGLNI